MLSKIYLAVLGLSIAIMMFFNCYAWSWLQSIGQPAAADAGFLYHYETAWPTLWITTGVLLMLGNAIVWVNGRVWGLWITFVYFAAFVLVRYFWLSPGYYAFLKSNGLAESGYSTEPFFGVILIVFLALVIFVDQFVLIRLRTKTYPSSPAASEEEPPPAEK